MAAMDTLLGAWTRRIQTMVMIELRGITPTGIPNVLCLSVLHVIGR